MDVVISPSIAITLAARSDAYVGYRWRFPLCVSLKERGSRLVLRAATNDGYARRSHPRVDPDTTRARTPSGFTIVKVIATIRDYEPSDEEAVVGLSLRAWGGPVARYWPRTLVSSCHSSSAHE